MPYDIIYSEEGSSFSKLKNPWWWFLYSKSPADGSFTVGASADGSSTTVGAPSDGPSTVGAPGKGSSVVGAPISIWAGSPNRGVLCGASYKENFPFCDVSLQRESLIPQLEGSDPSPKSKPIFHGSNKSTTESNPAPASSSYSMFGIILLTSVIFAQKEQEQKWEISMPALSQQIPARKDVIWRTFEN